MLLLGIDGNEANFFEAIINQVLCSGSSRPKIIGQYVICIKSGQVTIEKDDRGFPTNKPAYFGLQALRKGGNISINPSFLVNIQDLVCSFTVGPCTAKDNFITMNGRLFIYGPGQA
ncbi:hypothetical protein D3C73_1093910 [compost metagenome]